MGGVQRGQRYVAFWFKKKKDIINEVWFGSCFPVPFSPDLDSAVSSKGLDQILTPPAGQTPNKPSTRSCFGSVTIIEVVKPDGVRETIYLRFPIWSRVEALWNIAAGRRLFLFCFASSSQIVEERRTVRDCQGKEETTVTRSVGPGSLEGPEPQTAPLVPGQWVCLTLTKINVPTILTVPVSPYTFYLLTYFLSQVANVHFPTCGMMTPYSPSYLGGLNNMWTQGI